MEENKKTVPSFDQVAKAQLFEGKLMSWEDLRDMFVRDLKRCHVFMTEVIQCPPAVDALTDVYYERYKRMHEAMSKQPEIKYPPTQGQMVDQLEAEQDGV